MQSSIRHARIPHGLIVSLLLAGFAACVFPNRCLSQSDPASAPQSATDAPVILLTGFEPFGGRPQNASWEAVKALDGLEFHRHRLVCRQVPVVWGAPLTHLRDWTFELDPVAIFSFGEGRADGFDIETRASNRRGRIRDNNGATPSDPDIVPGGPERLDASIDHSSLQELLAGKGHPVRVSTNAGRYLCEECLYSLEYLRSTEGPDIDVMFCHVPPLGVEIDDKQVSAEFVQNYVEDLLESWYALANPAVSVQQAEEEAAEAVEAVDPRHAEVESFINLYFSSWSDRDLDTYGDCFAPDSCVQYISDENRIRLYQLQPFLDLQADVHRRSRARLRETPESINIRFERELARVVVYWKLVSGNRTEFGYDHFTLLKDSNDWKIVNLIFYPTPPATN